MDIMTVAAAAALAKAQGGGTAALEARLTAAEDSITATGNIVTDLTTRMAAAEAAIEGLIDGDDLAYGG